MMRHVFGGNGGRPTGLTRMSSSGSLMRGIETDEIRGGSSFT